MIVEFLKHKGLAEAIGPDMTRYAAEDFVRSAGGGRKEVAEFVKANKAQMAKFKAYTERWEGDARYIRLTELGKQKAATVRL